MKKEECLRNNEITWERQNFYYVLPNKLSGKMFSKQTSVGRVSYIQVYCNIYILQILFYKRLRQFHGDP